MTFGLGLGLFVWVLVIPLIGAIVRGRSVSFRLFGVCFCLLLAALPLTGVGATVALNGSMDAGAPVSYAARVRSKGSRTYRGGTSYYVRLEGLTDSSSAELAVPVEGEIFSSVKEGEHVLVDVGRGRFGWEWLKGIRHGG